MITFGSRSESDFCIRAAELLMFTSQTVLACFSQLNVEQNSFVLPDVNPPAAVLSLAVPLRPVRRQNHASRAAQVAAALCCREREEEDGLKEQFGSLIQSFRRML